LYPKNSGQTTGLAWAGTETLRICYCRL